MTHQIVADATVASEHSIDSDMQHMSSDVEA